MIRRIMMAVSLAMALIWTIQSAELALPDGSSKGVPQFLAGAFFFYVFFTVKENW